MGRDAAARIENGATRGRTLDCDSPLGEEVLGANRLILDEHQDWHMLVRQHHPALG